VQNVDPQFSMVLVQRTIHFGGTFFDNALQDHGPIEPFFYDVAARLGGRNGAWYVISAMVTLTSLVLAYVAARTARFAGGTRDIGVAVGAAVFVHFAISPANYAGVFYIRNMTTLLLALVAGDRGPGMASLAPVGCGVGGPSPACRVCFDLAAAVPGLVALAAVCPRRAGALPSRDDEWLRP
jgi:hypothetical protein